MTATASEQTDGQRDTRACCGDRRQRNGESGAERKGQGMVGCVREAEGRADMRAGGCVDHKILMTGGGGGGVQQSASRRSTNLAGELRAWRPGIVAIHWSRLTHRPAHLSLLPFPVPFRRDAGRPGSD